MTDRRSFVNFPAAFRHENAPCISHVTMDGERTLCGRSTRDCTREGFGWAEVNLGPDCMTCRKVWDRLPAAEKIGTV